MRSTNYLLASLPEAEYERLQPLLTFMEMPLKRVLIENAQPIESIYFPEKGIVSVVTELEQQAVEVVTIGLEGFVGVPVVLGADRCSTRAFVQVAGHGQVAPAAGLLAFLEKAPEMRRLLHLYVHAMIGQMAQTTACNRIHSIVRRCARWLLMSHDRVQGDCFLLTQEFLGEMLGVRRPQVNRAALALSQAGLIRYRRGRMEILDRFGLERAACECYQAVREEQRRIFESPTVPGSVEVPMTGW